MTLQPGTEQITMPRSVLVPDVKQLTDHYLRQQNGGNIVGFRGGRIQKGYGIGGMFKSLARIAIPLFKRVAKAVRKRALKAATDVGQDVLEGKNVLKLLKSRGSDAVKELAQQGAKTLVHQTGRGRKRKRGQRSNLAFTKRPKLCSELYYVPDRWITNDDSSDDEKSDSEISQAYDDRY